MLDLERTVPSARKADLFTENSARIVLDGLYILCSVNVRPDQALKKAQALLKDSTVSRLPTSLPDSGFSLRCLTSLTMQISLLSSLIAVAVLVCSVVAETHTVTFNNK